MSARGLMWASDHMPLSWGEIRPSGKTAVDSTNVKPGPREAIPPRWALCHDVRKPSLQNIDKEEIRISYSEIEHHESLWAERVWV